MAKQNLSKDKEVTPQEWLARTDRVATINGIEANNIIRRLVGQLDTAKNLLWCDHDDGMEHDKTIHDLYKVLTR